MIAQPITDILGKLRDYPDSSITAAEGEQCITVHELTSRTGAYYEKLRYLLDNKEEHLIRRSAIERILKRRVLIEQRADVGIPLLRELVAGGYLPNNAVPERIARDVQRIADRYLLVRDVMREKGQLHTDEGKMVLSMAAAEIEYHLFPSPEEILTAEAMYRTVRSSVQTSYNVTPEELDSQIYIACRRAYLRNDDPALAYSLWARMFPHWHQLQTDAQVRQLGEQAFARLKAMREQLAHPLGWQLVPKLRNDALYFSLVREIVSQYGVEAEGVLADTDERRRIISASLEEKYNNQHKRARKSGTRSTVYVLITKTVLGAAVELPYEVFILGTIHPVAIATNILFHPLLLLAMTRTIAKPGQENTQYILSGVEQVVMGHERPPITVRRKGIQSVVDGVFFILYAGLFVVTFGLIIWILETINFNAVSMLLFVFFLTLVTYLGLRIRFNAGRWQVDTGKEGILALLWNLFTLPLVRVGQWLNRRFASVNVFVFLLDFIIETPFKLLLQVLDAFMGFLKEKREEAYNV